MVPSWRPLTSALTATGEDPAPGLAAHSAAEPYAVVSPYSNSQELTCTPSGFTVPFSVTAPSPGLDAGPVTTSGTSAGVKTLIVSAVESATYATSLEASTATPLPCSRWPVPKRSSSELGGADTHGDIAVH